MQVTLDVKKLQICYNAMQQYVGKSKTKKPKHNQRTQSTHEQYSTKTLAAKNAIGQKYHYQCHNKDGTTLSQ